MSQNSLASFSQGVYDFQLTPAISILAQLRLCSCVCECVLFASHHTLHAHHAVVLTVNVCLSTGGQFVLGDHIKKEYIIKTLLNLDGHVIMSAANVSQSKGPTCLPKSCLLSCLSNTSLKQYLHLENTDPSRTPPPLLPPPPPFPLTSCRGCVVSLLFPYTTFSADSRCCVCVSVCLYVCLLVCLSLNDQAVHHNGRGV